MAKTRAYSFEFVCRHRHPDPAAADQNTAFGIAGADVFRDQNRVIGIVIRLIRLECAHVMHCMPELAGQLNQLLLHFVTGMIGPD